MKRWYFTIAAVLLVSAPVISFAQGNAGTGVGGGQGGGGQGGTGLAGQANTTLLGADVNLNFQTVFGNGASLANTNTDPFAAYRPSGSGTGSSTGTGTGSTLGSSFSGGGFNTNAAGGANRSGTGNLGTNNLNTNRGGTNLGTAGGGFAGGGALGGNRNTLGGGGFAGQQRTGGFGGNTGGFLGGGGGFLGGMNNQQQGSAPSLGYQVNYNGQPVNNITTTVTPSVDLQQRLSTSPGMQGVSNLQVFLQGDTAILRGKVASDYAKQLAAAMVRLEPGIYNVENQLEVAPVKP